MPATVGGNSVREFIRGRTCIENNKREVRVVWTMKRVRFQAGSGKVDVRLFHRPRRPRMLIHKFRWKLHVGIAKVTGLDDDSE